jgi:hypothetical protein
MHPLLNLLMTRQELLREHVQAYAELVAQEVNNLATAALCCGTASVVLGGVALMLGFSLQEIRSNALWALLLTPCLSLAGAWACVRTMRTHRSAPQFTDLIEQLRIDLQLLREVTSP